MPNRTKIVDPDTPLRSFGRRRGRKLSPRQQTLLSETLPRIMVDVNSPLAGTSEARPAWLEIGFGGGEHLIWQAENNPGVTFIGCEPFEEGVVKVLSNVEDKRLANVYIHPDDARAILPNIREASLDRVFILFPDPWPKRKHHKRRLINRELLASLARAMKRGAELRIGTDIPDYARTILMAFQASPEFTWTASGPEDWQRRPADWPQTRYEQKAVREDRRSCYLLFLRS